MQFFGDLARSVPLSNQPKDGQFPIRVLGDGGTRRVRSPTYEAVKNEMMQRALLEGLERARKAWLEELRHNVYIDVRL